MRRFFQLSLMLMVTTLNLTTISACEFMLGVDVPEKYKALESMISDAIDGAKSAADRKVFEQMEDDFILLVEALQDSFTSAKQKYQISKQLEDMKRQTFAKINLCKPDCVDEKNTSRKTMGIRAESLDLAQKCGTAAKTARPPHGEPSEHSASTNKDIKREL